MSGQASPGTDAFSPEFIAWVADNLSTIVLLIVIVWGAVKEWWVPGITHRRVVAERDQLLNLAVRSAKVAEKSVSAAEVIVTKAEDV